MTKQDSSHPKQPSFSSPSPCCWVKKGCFQGKIHASLLLPSNGWLSNGWGESGKLLENSHASLADWEWVLIIIPLRTSKIKGVTVRALLLIGDAGHVSLYVNQIFKSIRKEWLTLYLVHLMTNSHNYIVAAMNWQESPLLWGLDQNRPVPIVWNLSYVFFLAPSSLLSVHLMIGSPYSFKPTVDFSFVVFQLHSLFMGSSPITVTQLLFLRKCIQVSNPF